MVVAHWSLEQLGWSAFFAELFAPYAAKGLAPARVAVQHKSRYDLYTERGTMSGQLAGAFRHQAAGTADLPVTGDWLAIRPEPDGRRATIHATLPRRSAFRRKTAGDETTEQVLTANVDVLFLLASLSEPLNFRRLERYLVMAWESGASPVVVLSKADRCENADALALEVMSLAPGVPVHVTSSVTGQGLPELGGYFLGQRTVALLGASGVGKSRLINRLVGQDVQRVNATRSKDGKGRHTTTRRELLVVPGGGLIMDTPGLRALELWSADEGLSGAFDDIAGLAPQCRFADCRHDDEPHCAVKTAVERGAVPAERLESYRKLQRELAHLERQQSHRARTAAKSFAREVERSVRQLRLHRPKG